MLLLLLGSLIILTFFGGFHRFTAFGHRLSIRYRSRSTLEAVRCVRMDGLLPFSSNAYAIFAFLNLYPQRIKSGVVMALNLSGFEDRL